MKTGKKGNCASIFVGLPISQEIRRVHLEIACWNSLIKDCQECLDELKGAPKLPGVKQKLLKRLKYYKREYQDCIARKNKLHSALLSWIHSN